MKIAKTLVFIAAWLLSYCCGIYLYGVIFMGNYMSGIDMVMNICGGVPFHTSQNGCDPKVYK